MNKVFLDDLRAPPADDWIVCRTYDEFIMCLTNMESTGTVITHVSFDHDLGEDRNGHDAFLWLEEKIFVDGWEVPVLTCHSDNAGARKDIQRKIDTLADRLERWRNNGTVS